MTRRTVPAWAWQTLAQLAAIAAATLFLAARIDASAPLEDAGPSAEQVEQLIAACAPP